VSEPYHRFVFDLERRAFVGAFEEMYRREDEEGFDSWHQESPDIPARRIALALLAGRAWPRILDFGCGKGVFTSMLKTNTNEVVGVDVSETAVAKATTRDPRIDFRALGPAGLDAFAGERFALVVALEVLSYIEDWRGTVGQLAGLADHLLIGLFLPPDPIGFVKSLDELRAEAARVGTIDHEVLLDGHQLLLLVRTTARA
jgi:SAM-dependent methyltransferase